MNAAVFRKVAFVRKELVTELALVEFFSRVSAHVVF